MKLCLKFNIPSLYREAIYKLIDAEYDCDWYFGPTTAGIKEMDTSALKNVYRYRVIGNVEKVFWNVGTLHLLFKKEYQTYFTLIENRCLTDWVFFWLAFKFFKKKRFYIWTHGWYGRETGLDAKMKLWLYRNVSGTFVYGDRAKELLIQEGIPKEKLFAIHNSLDYDKQVQLRSIDLRSDVYIRHFNNNYPVLVMIGRLNTRKKIEMLLSAVRSLQDNGEYYNTVLVGDGPDKERLFKTAKDLNIEKRIWFYGACYDERANAELLFNSDLCVVPGDIGLTVIHSLTFGVPSISHNRFTTQGPEFEAIKPGETGDFFEFGDITSLASAISKWFANKKDCRAEVRQTCYREIDTNWTPYYQMAVIKDNLKL